MPNSNSLFSLKPFLAPLGRGLTGGSEHLPLCCPCNNLFAHELPFIISHLFLLSNTTTGVDWQSVNTYK